MKGLMWLARVGPSPLDPWRFAMGWCEVAAQNHAQRLEKMGWLERVSMVRGEGSLFFATRTGVRMLYRKRQESVEPVYGHTKHNRRFDRFHRRGRLAVRTEWRFAAQSLAGRVRAAHRAQTACVGEFHNGCPIHSG
jgi:hypothetical protein